MRVAVVGNFTQRHCSEVHWALTLEDLGHSVTRIQENQIKPGTLPRLVDGHDLFMWVRTWEGFVTHQDLADIRALGVPSVSYHLDLFVGLDRGAGLDTDPRWRCDFVFTPDGDPASAEVFKAKGVNHFYIKPGVYKPECKLYEPDGKTGNQVIFVGGGSPTGQGPQYGHKEWPYRGKLLKWLQDTYGERFSKYGHPQQTVRNEELNQLYANSKVVVGDSLCLNFHKPYFWSDRVYETLGRGGFIIHPDIRGLEEEFGVMDGDDEILVRYEYGHFDHLKQLIDFYLEHEDERIKKRNVGHQYVKENCTYHERLTEMLGVVGVS